MSVPHRKRTSVNRLLARIRNNKLVSLAVALGVTIIALGNFTDALTKLGHFFGLHSRTDTNVTMLKFASIEPAANGPWEASTPPKIEKKNEFSWIIDAIASEAAKLWTPADDPDGTSDGVIGDPVFDVTVRNISDDPVIITAIGFEVLMAGILHPTTGDGPEPYEIPIFKDYQIPFPSFHWDWNETSNWQRHVWDLRSNPKMASVQCKNPIALSAKRVMRYRLAISEFVTAKTPPRRVSANHALIRLIVIAGDAGVARSETIYLNTMW